MYERLCHDCWIIHLPLIKAGKVDYALANQHLARPDAHRQINCIWYRGRLRNSFSVNSLIYNILEMEISATQKQSAIVLWAGVYFLCVRRGSRRIPHSANCISNQISCIFRKRTVLKSRLSGERCRNCSGRSLAETERDARFLIESCATLLIIQG